MGLTDRFKDIEEQPRPGMQSTAQLTKSADDIERIDKVIDVITQNLSRKSFNVRLKKLSKIHYHNASIICDHILAEQVERNIKPSTIEGKIKALIWLSEYLNCKPFEQMSKADILCLGLVEIISNMHKKYKDNAIYHISDSYWGLAETYSLSFTFAHSN